MPKGVEHVPSTDEIHDMAGVFASVMPKGVEHMVRLVLMRDAQSVCFSDAERR